MTSDEYEPSLDISFGVVMVQMMKNTSRIHACQITILTSRNQNRTLSGVRNVNCLWLAETIDSISKGRGCGGRGIRSARSTLKECEKMLQAVAECSTHLSHSQVKLTYLKKTSYLISIDCSCDTAVKITRTTKFSLFSLFCS